MERFYNRLIIATHCFTALFASPSFAASDLEGGVKDLAEQISKNMITGNKKKVAMVDFSDLDGNVAALDQGGKGGRLFYFDKEMQNSDHYFLQL